MAHLDAPAEVIRANLEQARDRIRAASERSGRDPAAVRVCVAGKYVAPESMETLAAAGVRIVGENKLQDLARKQELYGDLFEWHFIGAVQSRKVPEIASRVNLIHSVCTESAATRLAALSQVPDVLVQVNVSNEPSKQGVAPADLAAFIELLPRAPLGLMTMPPPVADPERVRTHFRTLSELAADHGLAELSMGTSQDYEVAVEEGATIVRLGHTLFEPSA
jgi:pyridoxal phosphate enzyme (YggS family)